LEDLLAHHVVTRWLRIMPRFNLLRLASTRFTSRSRQRSMAISGFMFTSQRRGCSLRVGPLAISNSRGPNESWRNGLWPKCMLKSSFLRTSMENRDEKSIFVEELTSLENQLLYPLSLPLSTPFRWVTSYFTRFIRPNALYYRCIKERNERNPQEEKLTTSREEEQERRTAMCEGSTIGLPYESSRAILRYRADGTPC
jgi:hypothetical protein